MATIDTATGKEAPAKISQDRVKSIFSSIADRYELFNAVSSFGMYKVWLDHMMRMAPIGPADAVLDVAGGTGDVTFAVARSKQPACIVCSDLVPEMLEVAKRHISESKSESEGETASGVPVHFIQADAQKLPFDDGVFNAVTVAYGIRNMPNRELALSEMYRVLAPGGSLTCLEFSTPPNEIWNALYGIYLEHLIPFWGGLITGQREGFVYLSNSIKAFPDQEGLAKMMENAGFSDIHWENCSGGIAAIHVAHKDV